MALQGSSYQGEQTGNEISTNFNSSEAAEARRQSAQFASRNYDDRYEDSYDYLPPDAGIPTQGVYNSGVNGWFNLAGLQPLKNGGRNFVTINWGAAVTPEPYTSNLELSKV